MDIRRCSSTTASWSWWGCSHFWKEIYMSDEVVARVKSGDCLTCELRDGQWTMREAAIHWVTEHPEELEVLKAAMAIHYAAMAGL